MTPSLSEEAAEQGIAPGQERGERGGCEAEIAPSAVGEWGALAVWTGIDQGDLSRATPVERRRAVQFGLTGCPWSGINQVHGAVVEVVTRPGQQGGDADALVSAERGVALSVLSADCGAVALASPEGVIGAAHCGWRGLVAGVLPATVRSMRKLGASGVVGALGPCIHPCCYEFGEDVAAEVSSAIGHRISTATPSGLPALDLPAGIRAVLRDCGVRVAPGVDCCTACSPRHFSHRRDGSAARQAMAVWVPERG